MMQSTWSYIARIYVCADILCSLCENCEVVKVSCVESLAVGVSHVMRHKLAATLSLLLFCYRARCRSSRCAFDACSLSPLLLLR